MTLDLLDTRPLTECDKCGCITFIDKATRGHDSIIRSCRHCGHFMGFPRWHGVDEEPRTPQALPLAAELGVA